MKKIVFCTDSLNMGGIEKALISLLNSLIVDKKYQLKLCIKDCEKKLLEKELSQEIKYIYITRSRKENSFFRIVEKRYEFNVFKTFIEDADIIIDYYDGNFNKWFSTIKNKERIVFLHTILEKLHIFDKEKIKNILKKSHDKYVVLSEGAKKELLEYGIDEKRIFVIYNIFDFSKIIEQSQQRVLLSKKEEQLLKEKFWITVGRIVNDSKDYETIIEAFKNIDSKLYIIGDGPYLNFLKEKVEKIGMNKKIYFLGMKKNPYIWIKKSEGLILSSRYEGLSAVILEALILNKEVIASDCPYGPREILKNEKYGKIFSVGDTKQLENKIREKRSWDWRETNEFFWGAI